MKDFKRKSIVKQWLPCMIPIIVLLITAFILQHFEVRWLSIILIGIALIGCMSIFFHTCGEKRNFWFVIFTMSMSFVITFVMTMVTL